VVPPAAPAYVHCGYKKPACRPKKPLWPAWASWRACACRGACATPRKLSTLVRSLTALTHLQLGDAYPVDKMAAMNG